jgi:hypothetical protein
MTQFQFKVNTNKRCEVLARFEHDGVAKVVRTSSSNPSNLRTETEVYFNQRFEEVPQEFVFVERTPKNGEEYISTIDGKLRVSKGHFSPRWVKVRPV